MCSRSEDQNGRTNQPTTRFYPLEILSENNEVVNTDTIKNEDNDQQCTDDIDELSSQMEVWAIRMSAAKARQNISH